LTYLDAHNIRQDDHGRFMPNNPEATAERHDALRDILSREPVGNQDQLCNLLRKRGYIVTQSSVSRDLRELGAAKIAGRYVLPDALLSSQPQDPMSEIAPWLQTIQSAGPNLLVLRTPAGRASAVALVLDECPWREIVGTIAGDDTVFIATARRGDQAKIEARLSRLQVHNHG